MTHREIVKKRREKISMCLAKSMTRTSDIANYLGEEFKTINNDLCWMKKHTKKWLMGHTLDGYVYETKIAIDQLKDIELELQQLRAQTTKIDEKLKIIHELREVINMRWVMVGDGPTLMALKYSSNYDK